MKFTLLGTGTSQGIPVLGCSCNVCTSVDKKDVRLRASMLISQNNRNLVIDCGPDFRQQILKENLQRLDAVLFTHEHQDHIAGLDELRSFIFKQHAPMPLYAEERVLKRIKSSFAYAFLENPYPGAPSFDLHQILPGPLHLCGMEITAIRAMHGKLPVLGFRIKNVAYLTDVNNLESGALDQLQELDFLVLDALHHDKHHSHFTLQEAVEVAQQIGAKKTFFTHISHSMGRHAEINANLPKNMALAFDGLTFNQ